MTKTFKDSVWVKLHSSPRKFKVSINDNIDDIVKPRHVKLPAHTSPKAVIQITAETSQDDPENPPQTTMPPVMNLNDGNSTTPPPYTPASISTSGIITQAQVHQALSPERAMETLVQA